MESYDNVSYSSFSSQKNRVRRRPDLIPNHAYRNNIVSFVHQHSFFFFFFYFAKTFLRGFTIENFLPCKRGGRKISKHKRTRITEIRLPSLSSRRRLHVSFFFYHLFSYPIKRLNCERLITSIAIF